MQIMARSDALSALSLLSYRNQPSKIFRGGNEGWPMAATDAPLLPQSTARKRLPCPSRQSANGGPATAYEKTVEGIDPNSLATFSVKKYKLGQIDEIGKFGLLTLQCGTGGQAKCQLHAIVIEGGGWKDIPIGDPVSAETGFDQLALRFPIPLTPAVEELTP